MIGVKGIGKIIPDLMQAGGYKGYFTGHSLCRTEGSRLFQAGVQRKLVKETTGHSSDAVDAYQITSDEQKEQISNILSQRPSKASATNSVPPTVTGTVTDPNLSAQSVGNVEKSTSANPTVINVDEAKSKCTCASDNVGSRIDSLIANVSSSGKTTVKIQIKIVKE